MAPSLYLTSSFIHKYLVDKSTDLHCSNRGGWRNFRQREEVESMLTYYSEPVKVAWINNTISR
jgi:hypothetical protein